MSLNKFTIQKSFAISAGAGSGKTYTLSRRYINALLGFDYFREDYDTQDSYFEEPKPAKVNEVVTITYTEAAALEMKGRIFELVAKIINPNLSSDDEDYKSIEDANAGITLEQQEYVQKTLHQAYTDSANSKISTIHSYCLDIIKSNADIARIDTKLNIIKNDEKQKVLTNIIFEVLNSENNRDLVLDISADISMFFINNLINKYVSDTKFRNDYERFTKDSISVDIYKELIRELYPLPDITDEIKEEVENAQDSDVRGKWFDEYIKRFHNFTAVSWGDFKVVAVYKSGANKGKEHLVKLGLGEKTYPQLSSFIANTEKLVDTYGDIDTKKETLFFEKIDKIKNLLNQIKDRYDDKLNELGKIDFDTIIIKTREIIEQVETNYKYIMVDEFQDTNAIQFEIVKHSRNTNTNLFVVGDSKQAIYSFQGAEIEVFNKAICNEPFESIEPMDTNHRSDGVVLDTVNKIFKQLLKKDENLKLIKANYEAEAQDLFVFKKEREERGTFNYLITSQPYQTKEEQAIEEPLSELDTITEFVNDICSGKNSDYQHISMLIQNKEKAIAIMFDSSTRMLELKQKLRAKGITAKVSASENFYYTKEVNDIFNVLKAIDILLKPQDKPLSNSQKYYIAGAMRSNIIREDDNSIKEYLNTNIVSDKLMHYVEVVKSKRLSEAVKYIYDDSNVMGVYTHFDDIEQRVANLNKFLILCKEYEESNEPTLRNFLSLLEDAIYFIDSKEDEAFFQSENTKSVEICSIHSTKGLAYPLVLLANSEKGLYGQVQSDALKHNNFTLNDEKKEIVGFKINGYTPLSHRVLKAIDKLKHLAEKKRLLYVALTRAEHDVVISAKLNQTEKGLISLRKDSYLHMICESLEIDKDELYGQNENYCIQLDNVPAEDIDKETVKYLQHSFEPLHFVSNSLLSATAYNKTTTQDNTAANLGTATHKIIELYWRSFRANQNAILDKMMIFEQMQREVIVENMSTFYKSDVYKLLKDGVQHRFELEFNVDGKTGFIDFIYFDEVRDGWVIVDFKTGKESDKKNEKYQKQLDFYTEVVKGLGYRVVDARLLWLSE